MNKETYNELEEAWVRRIEVWLRSHDVYLGPL